jgi:hypothetical protein
VRRFLHSDSLKQNKTHAVSNKLRRTLDPIFAVSVGVAAAVVRINRARVSRSLKPVWDEGLRWLGKRLWARRRRVLLRLVDEEVAV